MGFGLYRMEAVEVGEVRTIQERKGVVEEN